MATADKPQSIADDPKVISLRARAEARRQSVIDQYGGAGWSPQPPDELNEAQRADFVRVAGLLPAAKRKPGAEELIASYVVACDLVRRSTTSLNSTLLVSGRGGTIVKSPMLAVRNSALRDMLKLRRMLGLSGDA